MLLDLMLKSVQFSLSTFDMENVITGRDTVLSATGHQHQESAWSFV